MDVNVVDGDGWPVRGLTPDDFTVTVDGAPRRVAWAEFTGLGTSPEAAPVEKPEGMPGVSTNESVRPGRLVVLVIDTGSIRPGESHAVIRSAEALLDRLGPRTPWRSSPCPAAATRSIRPRTRRASARP